jgi:isopenicillin N synthase-like dioxygenase
MLGKEIPIIDLASYLDPEQNTSETSKKIRSACKDVGFFYVKNHGVPEELITSIFQNSKKFFDLSVEEKK